MNRRSAMMMCVLALAPVAFPKASQDGSWYAQQVAKAEEKYRKEDKSPLHYFLGTEFGCYQMLDEYWMRLKERFGPFGWIRTTRNGGSKRFKADAELIYHLVNGPSNLVNVAKGVAGLFRERFDVDMHEPQLDVGLNCVWCVEGKSPPYDVCVKVCGPFDVSPTNGELRAYSLQFVVENRWLGENPKPHQYSYMKKKKWVEVFAPIWVEPERESEPDAWLYSPPKEPTTEEQVSRALTEKNISLVPRYAGYHGAFYIDGVDIKFTGCTEREADFFSASSDMFFKYCTDEKKDKVDEMIATLRSMEPRKPGVKRYHFVGNINGKVLPGDEVTWFSKDGDMLSGIVVAPEEDGEFVDAFNVKVRVTKRTLMPKAEDWLPTQASSNFNERTRKLYARLDQWRKDDNSLWGSTDRRDEGKLSAAHKENFRRKVNRLAELHGEYVPGVYQNVLFHNAGIVTKAMAIESVKRTEYQDMVRWQHGVRSAIRDLLSGLGLVCNDGRIGHVGLLTEEECGELGLSGYERNMIENGHEWSRFGEGDAGMGIRGVQPPHVPLYPRDGVGIEWNPDAYVKQMSGYTDSEAVDYVKAFSAYVEFATNVEAFADAGLAAAFAQKIASELKPKQRVWLVRELCLGYGVRSLAPWMVFAETGTIVSQKGDGKDSSAEIAWFRSVVGTQYFKGQMKRLADDAFLKWMRGKLDKFMDRKIKDADFDYVCDDEVLLGRHDYKARRPFDAGDVLPRPFTLFTYTFGKAYSLTSNSDKRVVGDMIVGWCRNIPVNSSIGNADMTVELAPRSRIVYEIWMDWFDIPTRDKLLDGVKWVRRFVEKELGGVKLADMVFEIDKHVCDEITWKNGSGGVVRSWTAFGPVKINIVGCCETNMNRIMLCVTDTAAETLVEKERKENPLKYDREAERRRFEQLKEMNRRRKVIPAKNTTK